MRPVIAIALAFALVVLLLSGVPQIGNGSFETPPPLAGAAIPGWSLVTASTAALRELAQGADLGMPVEGQKWLTFTAQGSTNAIPPSNPGGFGTPPQNAVHVAESFQLAGSATKLELAVVFLCNEQPNGSYRDFLSVDVGDGTTWRNLGFLDTWSAFPATSTLYNQTLTGSPMPATGVVNLALDLPAAFPGATSQTTFTLRLSLGNAVDGSLHSRGYFDHVRFTTGTPMPQAQQAAAVSITPWGANGDWLLDCQSPAWPYGELYNVFSGNTTQPLGTGPFAGIVPDYSTYFSIWQPVGTHPFHVHLDGQGRYQFVIPNWAAPGVTGDLFMAVLYAGQVVAISPPIRHTF